MPQRINYNDDLANAGDKRTIRGYDLDGSTVQDGNEITVYARQVPADKFYFHGSGNTNRNAGRSAFMYCDLVASGEGALTAGDPIDGELLGVITDSEQRHVQAEYVIDDLENLRQAKDDDRTDRPLQSVGEPAAREDQHLELRVRADPGSDGAVVDPEASEVKLYYTDLPR